METSSFSTLFAAGVLSFSSDADDDDDAADDADDDDVSCETAWHTILNAHEEARPMTPGSCVFLTQGTWLERAGSEGRAEWRGRSPADMVNERVFW